MIEGIILNSVVWGSLGNALVAILLEAQKERRGFMTVPLRVLEGLA